MLMMQKNDLKRPELYPRRYFAKVCPIKKMNPLLIYRCAAIMMNKREFRAAKDFFRKAKSLKACYPADRRPDQTD